MIKKSMIKLYQININQLTEVDGQININNEAELNKISDAESLFFQTLYRIQNKQFPSNKDETNTDVFILKTSMLDDNDKHRFQRELFQRIIQDGVIWNGQLYKRTISSTAMKRSQHTMFIRADLKEKLEEYLSLGKNKSISKTLISKYEASIGLSLSSAYLTKNKPKICVIEDFEKDIVEDVLQVRNYRYKPEDKEENERLEDEKEIYHEQLEQYKEAADEANQVLTQEYLIQLPKQSSKDQKSRTAWKNENRFVKADELIKPVAYGFYNDNYYPVYIFEQTDEMTTFPITPYMVGKEMEPIKDYPVKANIFDGMGICSFEWADWVSKELQLNETVNAFQIRNIMMKGLLVRFNFKSYFKKHNITKIKDLWGQVHNVNDLDWIITESQFKAALEKDDSKSKWLFSSIQEYQDLLDHYGFAHIGICNVAKPVHETNPYIKTAYQHLQAFNLPIDELRQLSRPTFDIANKLVKGSHIHDIAYAKAVLGMYGHENEEDYELYDYAAEAIDINHEMILDPQIRKYMSGRAREIIADTLQGRLFVKGFTNYIASDLIAFAEWAMFRESDKVNGYLNKSEFYCSGREGRYAGVRNPCVHFSEVVKMDFIESDNKWIQHLDNVIQLNTYDLTALRAGGADLDGDTFQVYDNEILVRNIINSDVIIPCPEEETKPTPKPLNDDAVLEYEMFSLSNAIGQITNIATTFANRSNSKNDGDPTEHSFECGLMKIWQGYEIDSQKSFHRETVPEILINAAKRQPYYLIHDKYGADEKNKHKFEDKNRANSPINRMVKGAEKWIKSSFYDNGEVNRIEFENYIAPTRQTYQLLQDTRHFEYDDMIEIVNQIKPIYEEWINEKKKIQEKFNPATVKGKEDRKEQGKMRSEAYSELNKYIRQESELICPNPSLLASAAVYIAYVLTKENMDYWRRNDNYSFPWIVAPRGLITNLKLNENKNKIDIFEVTQLNHQSREFAGSLSVKDGIAHIDDVTFKTEIPEGKYRLINVLGRHFLERDNERETNVILEPVPDVSLPSLEGCEVKLMHIAPKYTSDSLYDAISNMKLKINTNDNGYLSVFDDSHCVASIRNADIGNLGKYQGRTVTNIEPFDKTNKTVSIIFDVI